VRVFKVHGDKFAVSKPWASLAVCVSD